MANAAQLELNQLKNLIREAKPASIDEVWEVVDHYFAGTTWSVLKVEWDRLSPAEVTALVQKVYDER